jgi:pyrroline-5-carboxylate reductase
MSLDIGGRLVLLGAGKMGGAMLEGWLKLGLPAGAITAIDPHVPADGAARLRQAGVALNPEIEAIGTASVVLLAVKPQKMAEAVPSVARLFGRDTLALSIMAGKTIGDIAALLPPDTAIIRAMPNTPAAVGRGITVAVANRHVGEAQKRAADGLLRAIGKVEWIEDEGLIDAVTAVSGSGPAYVFHLVETMAAAGEACGLPPALALTLARATVEGAGELLYRSDLTAATLRENVTSPGGTTAAALAVLRAEDGLAPLMVRAIEAAKRRAGELSG